MMDYDNMICKKYTLTNVRFAHTFIPETAIFVPQKRKTNHIREEVVKMGTTASTAPKMLTIQQTAKLTGISEFHIRKLLRENKIVHIRTGVKYLVNFDKFIEYLNSGTE